jgi:iron complex outermembrane recepter protein
LDILPPNSSKPLILLHFLQYVMLAGRVVQTRIATTGMHLLRSVTARAGSAVAHCLCARRLLARVRRLSRFVILATIQVLPAMAAAEGSGTIDLTQMSLTDLAKVQVTSVSKTSESLQRASATVYVITHEDIDRSGVTSIPEALRLAPNLLVTQTSSSAYVISARGFSGNPTAQSFSNKLLILIDGRSVYTPLFSGIYANTLDLLLEDVDRIEVISGVGATLWGANAMNGVINIITRSSTLTQGTWFHVGGGNQEQFGEVRVGGRINPEATFRVYALGFHREAMERVDRSSAGDGWSKGQAGFRADWTTDQDSLTIQGDFYRGNEHILNSPDGSLLGANVLALYRHTGDVSETQLQLYVDQTEQFGPAGGTAFVVHTYDAEFQQAINLGARHRLVWGGGQRLNRYSITNSPTLLFSPNRRNLRLGNLFIQDTFAVSDSLSAILGVKLEDDPYSRWSVLPDARLSWALGAHATLWASASRAIRSPTPFDTDVVEKLGDITYLNAHTQFRPEETWAYEVGSRVQVGDDISISTAAFYNTYDDLRSVEPASASVLLPLYWGNSLRGHTYGVDGWATWQVTGAWRVSPGVSWVRERLAFKPGASGLLGVGQAANDPSIHASLATSLNLSQRLTANAALRYVGAMSDPAQGHYYDLDVRIAWKASETLELSLRGSHLLHRRQAEYPVPFGEQIPRAIAIDARVRF